MSRCVPLAVTRSITTQTFAAAAAIADALTAGSHDAHVTSDSKGRPTLITDADEGALNLAIDEACGAKCPG